MDLLPFACMQQQLPPRLFFSLLSAQLVRSASHFPTSGAPQWRSTHRIFPYSRGISADFRPPPICTCRWTHVTHRTTYASALILYSVIVPEIKSNQIISNRSSVQLRLMRTIRDSRVHSSQSKNTRRRVWTWYGRSTLAPSLLRLSDNSERVPIIPHGSKFSPPFPPRQPSHECSSANNSHPVNFVPTAITDPARRIINRKGNRAQKMAKKKSKNVPARLIWLGLIGHQDRSFYCLRKDHSSNRVLELYLSSLRAGIWKIMVEI